MRIVVKPQITGKLRLLRKRHFPSEIIAKPPPFFTLMYLHRTDIGKDAVNETFHQQNDCKLVYPHHQLFLS
jgi:hypothetical protein